MKTQLITAICTPLQKDNTLHSSGLEAHVEDQWSHEIAGLLVAGTMGLMQLQTDDTYHELVQQSIRISKGRGEILVGVGDTCFARTLARIRHVEQFDIDGVVVVSPYLVKFSQAELIDYFRSLANVVSKPLYMYDLPGFTGTKLQLDTVEALAQHPNIRGIKCSGAWEDTRQLIDRVGEHFRVIPAQPHLVDQMVRLGISANLDGIFGIVPELPAAIVRSAEAGEWSTASRLQQRLSQLLHLLRDKYTVFGGCEVILNARGIPGRLAPAPMRRLNDEQRDQLLDEPLVQQLIARSYCAE